MANSRTRLIIDGLRRHQAELERDFCFRDIIPEIINNIPPKLFKDIDSTKEEDLKLNKLYEYFIYEKKDIQILLQILGM